MRSRGALCKVPSIHSLISIGTKLTKLDMPKLFLTKLDMTKLDMPKLFL